MQSKVVNVSSRRDFLGVLDEWLQTLETREGCAHPLWIKDVRIYLPNLRLVRGLKERLLWRCQREGRVRVMPWIEALGDVDISVEEDGLTSSPWEEQTDMEMLPSMHQTERTLLLYRLIANWLEGRSKNDVLASSRGVATGHGLHLAESLGRLMDELDIQEVGAEEIGALIPEKLAEHWQKSRDFLLILEQYFPKICQERGRVNAKRRQIESLRRLSNYFKAERPDVPVVIAGSTGSIPATADLMEAVVGLPQGLLVLPGLDRAMSREAWASLSTDVSHPQHGIFGILSKLQLRREQVPEWQSKVLKESVTPREQLLSNVMLPQGFYGRTPQEFANEQMPDGGTVLKGVDLFEAQNLGEEALVIACALRETLEHKEKRAALISSDKDLIRAVVSTMRRWGVEIDSSAGESVLKKGGGILIALLIEIILSEIAADKVQGLFYHPQCKIGLTRKEMMPVLWCFNVLKRQHSERAKSLEGLAKQLRECSKWYPDQQDKWELAEKKILEFQQLVKKISKPKKQTLSARIDAFIELCETIDPMIWRSEEGEKISETLLVLRGYSELIVEKMELFSFGVMLQSFLRSVCFHTNRRKLSRVVILEPMEARLQCFDRVILGGLNEGVWPRRVGSSPWLSRPMRYELGLLSQEQAVGLQAHDFIQAFGAKEVLLTRSVKRGEPTLEARWLSRLSVVMKRFGWSYDSQPFKNAKSATAALLKGPFISRYERPWVLPKGAAFPKVLHVTSFDRLREDPYIFYAEKILELRPPESHTDMVLYRERGILLHELMQNITLYAERTHEVDSENLRKLFVQELETKLSEATELPAMLRLIWREKWEYIGCKYIEELENLRRQTRRISVETRGEIPLKNDLVLRGRADRLDEYRDDSLHIVDLKTGTLNTATDIRTMKASQLALLALIAKRGGFNGVEGQVERVSLYPLTAKRKGTKAVALAVADFDCENASSWDEQAEKMVVDEVTPYKAGQKKYRASKKESRYLQSWHNFTRFNEWRGSGD